MSKLRPKIIVLDDDPTGSQTVHSCLLLTRWDVSTLKVGLTDECDIFFILTNTRSMSPALAEQVTKEVCQNLQKALAQTGIKDFLVVSRSDSTLRGHYPLETDVISAQLGNFDAHFLCPAFLEGGRVTKQGTHYLLVNDELIPVAQTEFAQDSVFGYTHSYLPAYVEEKTQGRIKASQVELFSLADIRQGCEQKLLRLANNQCCIVDATEQADLDKFAQAVLNATQAGKRFLFRSAASLLTSLAQLGEQPVPATAMAQYKPNQNPGIILVGSHVRKTTEQLARLLQEPDTAGIEVNVMQLRDFPATKPHLLAEICQQIAQIYRSGKTPVIYTSRQELTFPDTQTRLNFGAQVSSLLMDIVQKLPQEIGFLISKGGITSNDVLSKGLNLTAVRLLGQIIPGCSVVRTDKNHPQFPNLPVVLFPGNVGDEQGLVTVYRRLLPLN